MQALDLATENIKKEVAMEIKNLNNPPQEVVTVITTVADFIDDSQG